MALYLRLGGSPAVSLVVEKFYEIMLKDERVAHYFKSTDMTKQIQRQKQFITLVTGGPNIYEGVDMKKAHCKHAIGHMEFDATWENLETALKFYKVPQKQTDELKAIFYSVQEQIVTKKDNTLQKECQKPKQCPFKKALQPQTQKPEQNVLFQKLGGHGAIYLVVNKFYDLMLQDPRVSYYFSNTNIQKQRNSQIQFISMVTGGANNYTGKDMKTAHCPYKINNFQFDATWENLQKSLAYYAVDAKLIQQVREIFYSVQSDIVHREQKQENVEQQKKIDQKQVKGSPTKSYEMQQFHQVLMPVTTTLQQTTKVMNAHTSSSLSKTSKDEYHVTKCPFTAQKITQCPIQHKKHQNSQQFSQNPKSTQQNSKPLSQNQKRKIKQEIVRRQNQTKMPIKLNNCPYQKTYY